MLGLYIHIPFCKSKCPYCDFYSMRYSDKLMERYISALIDNIAKTGEGKNLKVDSVYFGGGTPSVLGGENIVRILESVNNNFNLQNPEITVECNPSTTNSVFYETISLGGVNRISLGMQSAVEKERRLLGRTANRDQVANSIYQARKAGISNISVDMMLGVPEQNKETLKESIGFIKEVKPEHISSYMLKLEEGTFFYKNSHKLNLPDEDEVCDMYLDFSKEMKKLGYEHYEISNFAKAGKRSRHNTKYWLDDEYIGFGPSAYSFYEGRRYHYDADIEKYISSREIVSDETGGSKSEYVMLALRLSDGLSFSSYEKRYGEKISELFIRKGEMFAKNGFAEIDSEHISLTAEGFLLSNRIIGELIDCL